LSAEGNRHNYYVEKSVIDIHLAQIKLGFTCESLKL